MRRRISGSADRTMPRTATRSVTDRAGRLRVRPPISPIYALAKSALRAIVGPRRPSGSAPVREVVASSRRSLAGGFTDGGHIAPVASQSRRGTMSARQRRALPPPANRLDDGLLAATLDAAATVTAAAAGPLPGTLTVDLDAGYDFQTCRQVLAARGMVGQIAARRQPAPIQAGRRWVIERTHAWANQYGKLRWCTDRRRIVAEFWLVLALARIVDGRLARRAWARYRREGRPHRRPCRPLAQARPCGRGARLARRAACRLPVALHEHAPQDLARQRPGNLVDELDGADLLVGRDALGDEVDDLLG